MTRLLLLIPILAVAACGSERVSKPYDWNDLRLVTGYTAKAACSCLFVEKRTADECAAYSKENPPIATWSADLDAKTVSASAVLLWGAKAHFVSDRLGCVLE